MTQIVVFEHIQGPMQWVILESFSADLEAKAILYQDGKFILDAYIMH